LLFSVNRIRVGIVPNITILAGYQLLPTAV